MQEWWVNMNRNGGSTWTGIYNRLLCVRFSVIAYSSEYFLWLCH
jgi:hypothetical protein